MTVHRAPTSIDHALARIAGQLEGGWVGMARTVSRSETTVRAWGQPGRREQIPMAAAIALDLAFQAAGGTGAPIFETYALQLDLACINRFADRAALGVHLASVIKESAEAESAMLSAILPDAGPAEIRRALRELEEALVAMGTARAMLNNMKSGTTDSPQIPP